MNKLFWRFYEWPKGPLIGYASYNAYTGRANYFVSDEDYDKGMKYEKLSFINIWYKL